MNLSQLQELAVLVPDKTKFFQALTTHISTFGLFRQAPAVLERQRRSAYDSISKLHRKARFKFKHLKDIQFAVVGNIAAATYGSTLANGNCLDIVVSREQQVPAALAIIHCGGASDKPYGGYYPSLAGNEYVFDNIEGLKLRLLFARSESGDSLIRRDYEKNRRIAGGHWSVVSDSLMFALSSIRADSSDIVDLVEVMQGGLEIDWPQVTKFCLQLNGNVNVAIELTKIFSMIRVLNKSSKQQELIDGNN